MDRLKGILVTMLCLLLIACGGDNNSSQPSTALPSSTEMRKNVSKLLAKTKSYNFELKSLYKSMNSSNEQLADLNKQINKQISQYTSQTNTQLKTIDSLISKQANKLNGDINSFGATMAAKGY